jgi:alpha-beta hydrolase superfamily lysophospholipase
MSAGPISAQEREASRVDGPTDGAKESFYFSSEGNTLFGWLHRAPAAANAKIGLVICNPFGYESICAHRSIRAFAEAAAATGVPAMRFDYAGTGDSNDIEPNTDQIELWVRDIVSASLELQRRTGVDKVCLLGFRLGALLATLAASRCVDVSGLLLIAPVIKGRKLLRELRTAKLAAALVASGSADALAPARSGSSGTEPSEFSGFEMSAATMIALSQIDLEASSAPAVSDMLIVDRQDLPVAGKWASSLSNHSVNAEYVTLPDFVESIMRPAESATIPHTMIGATCDWLRRYVSKPQHTAKSPLRPTQVRIENPEVLSLPGPEISSTLTERRVSFGTDPFLFGIVTEPSSGESRRRALIMLNAGAVHHIGVSRNHVSLARSWAKRGYVVLRLDLAGMGDSDTRPGRPDNEAFPPAAFDDIRRAIDFLRDRYGIREITLVGLCSGAYHALRAATTGLPVNRILMVNPQNFFWKEGMTRDDLQQAAEAVLNPVGYRKRLLSATHWKRLFTGQVQVLTIPRVLVRRTIMALETRLRDLARRLHIRLPSDLGSDLEQIVRRGVRVVMVFAKDEPGLDLLKLQAGSSIKRLGDQIHIHVIEGADHIFSQRGPRSVMERILADELYTRTDAGPIAARNSGMRIPHPL